MARMRNLVKAVIALVVLLSFMNVSHVEAKYDKKRIDANYIIISELRKDIIENAKWEDSFNAKYVVYMKIALTDYDKMKKSLTASEKKQLASLYVKRDREFTFVFNYYKFMMLVKDYYKYSEYIQYLDVLDDNEYKNLLLKFEENSSEIGDLGVYFRKSLGNDVVKENFTKFEMDYLQMRDDFIESRAWWDEHKD